MKTSLLLLMLSFLLSFNLFPHQYSWAKSIGGIDTDRGFGITVDQHGNVNIAGIFRESNVDFDPGRGSTLLFSKGRDETYLPKYNFFDSLPYLGMTPPDSIPLRFGTPELISDGTWGWHSSPVFSPDGRKLTFVKYHFNLQKGPMKIYEMDDINGVWTAPYRPSYTTDSSETSPIYTPDGNSLMFLSKRSGTWKIYKTDKTGNVWSSPQLVNFDYNSLPGYFGMNISIASDSTMYFDLFSPQNGSDEICKAELVNDIYTQFQILPAAVNSPDEEGVPFIAPDESWLMFISTRPGGIGLHDIYISFRKPDNTWTAALNMGNRINGTHEDAFPFLSPDKEYMFFVSAKQNDLAYNAYWVGSDVISKLNQLVSVEDAIHPPAEFNLYQNYPNPFNPVTNIRYQLPAFNNVTVKIFDLLGREIETLVDEGESAGLYEITWNAANLPSGVYLYQIQAGEYTAVKKMLLIK